MVARYPLSSFDDELLLHCSRIIYNDGILCVPTDTVYGFICWPYSVKAIHRIMDIKRRPEEKPFALFVSSWKRLCQEPVIPSDSARILSEKFWPGALTIVVEAEEGCPAFREGTVGVRCPNTPFLLRLMEECGGLLINTSLNRSGEPAVSSLEGMDEILEETDLVIDAGIIPPNKPSTVVDCISNIPVILREGEITEEEIMQAVKKK